MYQHQFNPYATNIEIVKGYLKSGKTLTLGILYLFSIVLSFVTVLTIPSSFMNAVPNYVDMLRSMGIDPSQANVAVSSTVNGMPYLIAYTAVSAIFTLLIAIGFLLMFAKSRNDHPTSNPSGGASILRAISLIYFICAVLVVVLLVFFFVAAYFSLDYFVANFNLNPDYATALWITCGVLIFIISFFYLFIAAACKSFYRSIKYSLTTVDLYTKGAVAYGVFNIIGAVFMGLAFIGSIISVISTFSITTLLSMLSTALTFFITVMTASFALGYNRYIKEQKFNYAAPRDGGPNGAYFPSDYSNAPNPYGAPQQVNPYQENDSVYQAPQNAPTCPNCGAPVDGSPFCSNCGTKL